MSKIKLKKIILLVILFSLIFIYSMAIKPISADEIWEYGFGYNISKGLVPYRDFNMIVTPFYPFCLALFIKIFGHYLLSAHIFNTILLIITISLMFKMIGNKSMIIVPILMYSLYNILPTYNSLIFFLTILLIYIKQQTINKQNNSLLSGLIISIMVLTKQSIGIVFFILELILTKNKRQYLLTFLIPIIILLIYLKINNALYSFIDYCVLGILDFAETNSKISYFFIVFIIMVTFLVILYKKYKNKDILYGLAFMSMCVPLFDYSHTLISFVIFLFTILKNIKYKESLTKYICIYLYLFFILIISCEPIVIYNQNNYLKGRNIGNIEYAKVIENTSYILDQKYDKYDKVYIFLGPMSNAIKMYRNEPINKYDNINNGNIGYNGDKKYIKEIDNYCNKNKCLFLLKSYDFNKEQVNKKIIDYIKNNYKYIEQDKYNYFYDYIKYYSN